MSSSSTTYQRADNASLRPYYKRLPANTAGYVKENGRPTPAVWLMVENQENRDRYNAACEGENAAITHTEALERAGAAFFPHWHQCELLRHERSPTLTTNIAFGKLEMTEENLRLAEEELSENPLGLDEGQIVEERKSLQWLQEEQSSRSLTLEQGR